MFISRIANLLSGGACFGAGVLYVHNQYLWMLGALFVSGALAEMRDRLRTNVPRV